MVASVSQYPRMRNLSVSKIEKAMQCPLQFKYRYIDRIPELTGGLLHAGNVLHEILEFALHEEARTGKYPPVAEMDDLFEPAWTRRKAEQEEKPWFIGWQWAEDDPEEKVKAEYRQLVHVARKDALPKVRAWMMGDQPMIERRIDLEFESEVGNFPLIGYLDLLDASGTLMDWKTTGREVSERQKKTWLQFAAYSFFTYPLVGEEFTQCQKIFLVRGEDPHVEFIPFTVGQKHREFFTRIAAEVWKMVFQGGFPLNNNGWWCKPDFCSFYGSCQGELAK